MDNEVVQFCQKAIIDSGLVLDEDLIFIRMVECDVRKAKADISRDIIILATAVGTTYYAMKKGDVAVTVFSFPAACSFIMSCYYSRRSKNHKDLISHLLTEFRNLSRIHSEVNEFFKRFDFSMNSSKNTFIKISEDTISGLSKYSCDIQSSITRKMQSIISEIHVGLQDVSLDLTGFEKATAVSLNHDTVTECLHNASFIEGQVVLLRSHLLTSIFLISSSKGDPAIFIRVLDKSIPSLRSLIQKSGIGIKAKLNETRFPFRPPSFSLSNIENTFAQRKNVPNNCFPRMKKHVMKINDGICCTLIKLKSLLETVETIESEYGMDVLQEAVSTLSQELYGCYKSSADLEKLIQLLNRKSITKSSIEESQEDFATACTSDTTRLEAEELIEDSDYQVFTNDVNDADNECDAVRFYKRFMKNDIDWLAELKQSDEFQKRQNKFGTGAPITSTPMDQQHQAEKYETALSESSTSSEKFMTPPPPPPLPRPYSSSCSLNLSDIMLKFPPIPDTPEFEELSSMEVPMIPAPPLVPLTLVEDSSFLRITEPSLVAPILSDDSSLFESLQNVLERMGRSQEDNYE